MIIKIFEGMFRNAIMNFLAFLLKSIFVDLILGCLVKGIGFLIVRIFSKKEIDREGSKVVVAGAVFWLVMLGIYLLYQKLI